MQTKPKVFGISLGTMLVLAFIIVGPLQVSAQVSDQASQEDITNCTLQHEIDDAINQNTVKNRQIAKTIHAEKQIYDCDIDQGNVAAIVDVTIYLELFTNITDGEVLKTSAHVVTCVKIEDRADVLNCFASVPDDVVVFTSCEEDSPSHPQEMDTVNKGSIALTVESQKEVFTCDFGSPSDDDKKVDLVLFTLTRENLNTQDLIDIQVLDATCVVRIASAEVEQCTFTAPSDITP